MLLDYITAVAKASLGFAKGGGEMIEFLICGIVFFIPKFWKQFEEADIQFEQSLRKIFFWKFTNNDKWRFFIVFGGCFIFHILVIAPYQVYKTTRIDNPKSLARIIKWDPPTMTNDTPGIEIFCGGGFVQWGNGKTFQGVPIQIPMDAFRTNKSIIIPVMNYPALSVSVVKKRIYLDFYVPTKTSPIQIEAGESDPLPEGWDWNSDSNTLEIVDDQNQAVFQEVFLNPNRAWIIGAIQSGGEVIPLQQYGGEQPMQHGYYTTL